MRRFDMGKVRAVIPIVLALVIAAAGSMFLYKWVRLQKTPQEESVRTEFSSVPVTTAAVDLPWGTKLNKQMLKEVPFLKQS